LSRKKEIFFIKVEPCARKLKWLCKNNRAASLSTLPTGRREDLEFTPACGRQA